MAEDKYVFSVLNEVQYCDRESEMTYDLLPVVNGGSVDTGFPVTAINE